jgi:hypothetical protein
MKRQGRDWLGIALATAGVVGAISLAGIFIVYLIDSLGDDDSSKPAASSQLGRAPTGPTAATGSTGANNGTTGSSKSGGTTGSSKSGAARGKAGTTGGKAKTGADQAKIPDGQQYATYTNRSGGYSILIPRGWKKRDKGKLVGFSLHGNFVLISSGKGKAPTAKSVSAQIAKNKGLKIVEAPRQTTIGGNSAVVATVRNSKRPVVIDQYHLGKDKKVVAVNLGTPSAVSKDNADDYRRIANSFHWL